MSAKNYENACVCARKDVKSAATVVLRNTSNDVLLNK